MISSCPWAQSRLAAACDRSGATYALARSMRGPMLQRFAGADPGELRDREALEVGDV